jgi:hypothetical protein
MKIMNIEENKKKLIEEKKLLEDELGSLGKFDKKTGDWQATPETQTAPEAKIFFGLNQIHLLR